MGNVNVLRPVKQCRQCKYYFYGWVFDPPEYTCTKGNDVQYYISQCSIFEIKTNLIVLLLKKLFYNFIMVFQEEYELNKNPEWIRFLCDLKNYKK